MIRQFDVFPNPLRSGRDERPYLIVVQHNFHSELPTRVLLPLVPATAKLGSSRLSPTLIILDRKYALIATDVFTLPVHRLRDPVANLAHERSRIIAALDLVFTAV